MVKLARPTDFVDSRHSPSKDILAQIGQLAVVSASIEDILHAIHWKFLKLSDPVGAVITGDMNPNRLMEDIIRIGKAAKIDKKITDDLTDIFAEYKTWATLRNQCIHWVWSPPKGGNFTLEPPPYKPSHQPVILTKPQIEEMIMELIWIEARLDAHALKDAELAKLQAEWGEMAEIQVPTPWLDKLPQQAAKPSNLPGTRK